MFFLDFLRIYLSRLGVKLNSNWSLKTNQKERPLGVLLCYPESVQDNFLCSVVHRRLVPHPPPHVDKLETEHNLHRIPSHVIQIIVESPKLTANVVHFEYF